MSETLEQLLDNLGLTLEEAPRWLEDSDDPDELRQCLERQRIAAWLERRARAERAVICEVRLDPQRPLEAQICIATPTGDRAQEMELVRGTIRGSIEHMLGCQIALSTVRGLRKLALSVDAGEVPESEAWERVVALFGPETDAPVKGPNDG